MNDNLGKNFELLSINDLEKFQEFINKYWEKDHIFTIDTSVFDWQHRGQNSYHYMIIKQNGRIIGVHGIIPLTQFDKKLTNTQLFLGLWRILDGFGIAMGFILHQKIIEKYKPNFVAGIGLNDSVIPYYKRLGYKCNAMGHFVMLSPFIKEFKLAKVPNDFKIPNQNKNAFEIYENISHERLRKLNTDSLYSHQVPLKSDTYLINRYLNHPVYIYNIYAISNGNTAKALCIVRPIYYKDSVVLRIIDYVGHNNSFELFHDLFLTLLDNYKAEYIDLYSVGLPINVIKNAGFKKRNNVKGLIIPSNFEPYENKNVKINYGYLHSDHNIPVRLFKGDGDADRPRQLENRN